MRLDVLVGCFDDACGLLLGSGDHGYVHVTLLIVFGSHVSVQSVDDLLDVILVLGTNGDILNFIFLVVCHFFSRKALLFVIFECLI